MWCGPGQLLCRSFSSFKAAVSRASEVEVYFVEEAWTEAEACRRLAGVRSDLCI